MVADVRLLSVRRPFVVHPMVISQKLILVSHLTYRPIRPSVQVWRKTATVVNRLTAGLFTVSRGG